MNKDELEKELDRANRTISALVRECLTLGEMVCALDDQVLDLLIVGNELVSVVRGLAKGDKSIDALALVVREKLAEIKSVHTQQDIPSAVGQVSAMFQSLIDAQIAEEEVGGNGAQPDESKE